MATVNRWTVVLPVGILLCLLIGFYSSGEITSSAASFFKQRIQGGARISLEGSNASDVRKDYTDIITKIKLSSTECKNSDEIQSLLKDLMGILSSSPYNLPQVNLGEVKKTIPSKVKEVIPTKCPLPKDYVPKFTPSITDVNEDVCAEPFAYKRLNGGVPNFYKGFNMLNCTGVPAFNTLLTMVYNFVNYSSEDLLHIPRLLNSVNKVYPGIAILAALPSDSNHKDDQFNHTTFTKYKKNTAATDIWNKLIAEVKTKYVYIGKNVIHFTWFDRLERLVREVNNLGAYAVGASYRTLRNGHWRTGCEQTTLRNYSLAYEHGYRVSIHECMICDHVEGPFVTKSQLFKKVPLRPSVAAVSGFAMWFLTLKKKTKGVTAASCPDAMSFVTDDSEPPTDKSHWIHLAKALQVEKIHPPMSPTIEFSCDEARTHCSQTRRTGMALSHCCLRKLSTQFKLVLKLCLEYGILCEISDGTLMGAIKFSGILPWEADADFSIARPDFQNFDKLGPAIIKQGYTWTKVTKGVNAYLVRDSNWKTEIFPHPNLDSAIFAKQGLNQTLIYLDGSYVATCASPGLLIRNRYGVGAMQHVQHWSQIGKTSSWMIYPLGKFTKCPKPGHHACLDQFRTDGSLQFTWP